MYVNWFCFLLINSTWRTLWAGPERVASSTFPWALQLIRRRCHHTCWGCWWTHSPSWPRTESCGSSKVLSEMICRPTWKSNGGCRNKTFWVRTDLIALLRSFCSWGNAVSCDINYKRIAVLFRSQEAEGIRDARWPTEHVRDGISRRASDHDARLLRSRRERSQGGRRWLRHQDRAQRVVHGEVGARCHQSHSESAVQGSGQTRADAHEGPEDDAPWDGRLLDRVRATAQGCSTPGESCPESNVVPVLQLRHCPLLYRHFPRLMEYLPETKGLLDPDRVRRCEA